METVNKILTVAQKKKILDDIDSKVDSKRRLALQYGITQSTLAMIIENRDKIDNSFNGYQPKTTKNKPKILEYEQLELKLHEYYLEMQDKNVYISGPDLLKKATAIAIELKIVFKPYNGWLDRFLDHYEIDLSKNCGQRSLEWLIEKRCILDKYEPRNIYNIDEIILNYNFVQNSTWVLACEDVSNIKTIKKKMATIVLCTNMDGSDKRKLTVIGNNDEEQFEHLLVNYERNDKRQMTHEIFKKIIIRMQQDMDKDDRKMLLILNKNRAHRIPKLKLPNVEFLFLPGSTKSILQPLNQGIIRDFKTNLKKEYSRFIVNEMELNDKWSIYEACNAMSSVWQSMASQKVLDSFIKSGIHKKSDEEETATDYKNFNLRNIKTEKNDEEMYSRIMKDSKEEPCVSFAIKTENSDSFNLSPNKNTILKSVKSDKIKFINKKVKMSITDIKTFSKKTLKTTKTNKNDKMKQMKINSYFI